MLSDALGKNLKKNTIKSIMNNKKKKNFEKRNQFLFVKYKVNVQEVFQIFRTVQMIWIDLVWFDGISHFYIYI